MDFLAGSELGQKKKKSSPARQRRYREVQNAILEQGRREVLDTQHLRTLVQRDGRETIVSM